MSTILSSRRPLPTESQLCLSIAAGCLLIGAVGYMVNWLQPDSTHLSACLPIGMCYLLWGLCVWWRAPRAPLPARRHFRRLDGVFHSLACHELTLGADARHELGPSRESLCPQSPLLRNSH